jgi:hypothetical protein
VREHQRHGVEAVGEVVADDGDGDGGTGVGQRVAASPVHAYLDYATRNDTEPETISFNSEEGAAYVSVGGDLYDLDEQVTAGLNGLLVEQAILTQPQHWAFTAVAGADGGVQVLPDATLERLSLAAVPAAELDAFRDARGRLFAALAATGSAYAVATGVAEAEAAAYIEAFAALLAALPVLGAGLALLPLPPDLPTWAGPGGAAGGILGGALGSLGSLLGGDAGPLLGGQAPLGLGD